MTERAKDLPGWFLIAFPPATEPQPCSVLWRSGCMMRIQVFDSTVPTDAGDFLKVPPR